MDDEQIEKVKKVLVDWNPLGDQASKVEDLDNYQIEAEDILFQIDKKSSIDWINKILTEVISQAFGVYHQLNDTKIYAEKIRKILNG
ncbi:hypothetical protein [Yeosuana marina]|uniref:hypothetical protein n=1 Tax=Yeosuana marina TaxID=1565536 RepID=UPI0030ED70D5|tara:strand:+ start:191 stop:451 length:261 start_codon:yes stop_codon:yes gene_type:complete